MHDRPITAPHEHAGVFEIGLCRGGGGIPVVESKVLPFAVGDTFVGADRECRFGQARKGTTAHWSELYIKERLLGKHFGSEMLGEKERFSGPAFHTVLGAP